MKTALVTGCDGFLGRHFARHLADDGYYVDAVDIASNHPEDCVAYFNEFTDHGPDLVVHCAAVIGGRKGIDGAALKVGAENLSLDAALFKWAFQCRPGRIVYFSSSSAYPIFRQSEPWHLANPDDRLSEDTIWDGCGFGPELDPDQTYGWTKLTGERLAQEANAENIPTFVFRPFSGYGADQHVDYPFPAFVRRAASRQEPFPVWGSAASARDWIHVDDIVNAVMTALDHDIRGPVNLCSGQATMFWQLAEACMDAAGYHAAVVENFDAPQGVFWRVGDPTLMNTFYTPTISLEEGIRRAMKGHNK